MTRMSISRAFTALAAADPTRVAASDGTRTLTRADLDAASNALARVYLEAGVTTDSLVTVLGGNDVDTVLAYVAIWKAGGIPQPLSPRLPAADRDAVLAVAAPALVVGGTGTGTGTGGRTGRITTGDGLRLPWLPLAADRSGVSTALLPDVAASSWKAPTSSGSTGTPKVVLAAASAHVDPSGSVAAFIPHRATQLVAGPLHHAAPFVYAMRGLMTGHTVVLLPRFTADAWLSAVAEHRVTWGMVVPTMMSRVLALGPEALAAADTSTLESVLHIGAVCPPHVKRGWIDWLGGSRVFEVYSGTESNGLTMIRGDEWLEHPGSVGRPVGGSSVRIVGPDGVVLPPGALGTIEMTRPGPATYRYLGRPVPPDDAWHTLGDAGWLSEDGYLSIADRQDDLIVTGGVNVWPAAVESALERHPAIRTCVVVGIPDDDLGQRIRAVVDVDPASDVSAASLASWAADALDPEQRPREWTIVHDALRDDTGKVRRGAWR